ncbi:hypothetical protein BH18ACI2_BH18ACI2_16360 [soil metagenome]
MSLTTIAIGGFSSDTGKTNLLCELLRALPGWEAIKVTRGHYRSCGKDPHACCVSQLLSEEPLICSGRAKTDVPGKDTGRYWEAGAANVHWVVVTDKGVEPGVRQALSRVEAGGVLVEGTSFTQFVKVDFLILAARASGGKIKPSARRALARADAIYLFDEGTDCVHAREQFAAWREASPAREALRAIPLYTRIDFPQLVARVRAAHHDAAAGKIN